MILVSIHMFLTTLKLNIGVLISKTWRPTVAISKMAANMFDIGVDLYVFDHSRSDYEV